MKSEDLELWGSFFYCMMFTTSESNVSSILVHIYIGHFFPSTVDLQRVENWTEEQ